MEQTLSNREDQAWKFASVVTHRHHCLVAKLDLLFLRPEEPGIIRDGDIDNRLKTLFDALSIPSKNQIPEGANPPRDDNVFHCLLDDDSLITGVNVNTDRLLGNRGDKEVMLIIGVEVSCTHATVLNLAMTL